MENDGKVKQVDIFLTILAIFAVALLIRVRINILNVPITARSEYTSDFSDNNNIGIVIAPADKPNIAGLLFAGALRVSPLSPKPTLLESDLRTRASSSCLSPNLPGWPAVNGDILMEANDLLTVGEVGFSSAALEVMGTSKSGQNRLSVLSNEGDLLFDITDSPFNSAYNTIPSLGDLDGDGIREIVTGGQRGLFVVNNGVSQQISSLAVGFMPVVIDDLDSDGQLELIWTERIFVPPVGQRRKLHVTDRFGNDLLGWPVTLLPEFNNVLHSAIAVGDLDNDGRKEIVIVAMNGANATVAHQKTPTVLVFGSDGSLTWSFSSPYPYVYYTPTSNDNIYFNDVALGDVNGDRFLDVVYLQGGRSGDDNANFFILNYAGQIQSQWSITDASFGLPGFEQIALGDLDRDGSLEIIATGKRHVSPQIGQTFAWRGDGTLLSGFPVTPSFSSDTTAAPMVADVSGDGFPDIISSLFGRRNNYYNRIYGWDRNGQVLPCWPKELIRQSGTPQVSISAFENTTLTDINKDRMLDLVAPIGSAEIHAIQLLVPMYTKQKIWPMFRHDAARTGRVSL